MEHRITKLPALTVVGLHRELDPSQSDGPSKLWGEFIPRASEIANNKPETCYGMTWCGAPDAQGKQLFNYMPCVSVEPDAAIPEGMAKREIAAAEYAVFTHSGHISGIGESFGKIFGEGMAATGRTPAMGMPSFEHYDHRYEAESGMGEVDIYVPLEATSD